MDLVNLVREEFNLIMFETRGLESNGKVEQAKKSDEEVQT